MKQQTQFQPPESLSSGYQVKERNGVWQVSFSVRGEKQQRYSLGTRDRAKADRLAYARWVHACMLVQNGQSLSRQGFSEVAEEYIETIEKDVQLERKARYHLRDDLRRIFVDGVIKDRLGLDRVYVQAKRYAEGNTVGSPDIQGFVGSLVGLGASKGVLVTTSSFSQQARDFVRDLSQRVVLLDGK